jgi:putative flippase GtrA
MIKLYSYFEYIWNYWFSLKKPIRYLLVGGFNTLFSIALFAVCYNVFNEKIGYITILVGTHFISVLNSTATFQFFVFRSKNFVLNYARANVTYLAYLCVNAVLLKISKDVLDFDVIYSQIAITLILIVPFYFINKLFSFA